MGRFKATCGRLRSLSGHIRLNSGQLLTNPGRTEPTSGHGLLYSALCWSNHRPSSGADIVCRANFNRIWTSWAEVWWNSQQNRTNPGQYRGRVGRFQASFGRVGPNKFGPSRAEFRRSWQHTAHHRCGNCPNDKTGQNRTPPEAPKRPRRCPKEDPQGPNKPLRAPKANRTKTGQNQTKNGHPHKPQRCPKRPQD